MKRRTWIQAAMELLELWCLIAATMASTGQEHRVLKRDLNQVSHESLKALVRVKRESVHHPLDLGPNNEETHRKRLEEEPELIRIKRNAAVMDKRGSYHLDVLEAALARVKRSKREAEAALIRVKRSGEMEKELKRYKRFKRSLDGTKLASVQAMQNKKKKKKAQGSTPSLQHKHKNGAVPMKKQSTQTKKMKHLHHRQLKESIKKAISSAMQATHKKHMKTKHKVEESGLKRKKSLTKKSNLVELKNQLEKFKRL